MTWRITKASPVAGVRVVHAAKDGPPDVRLRMDEAFDEDVSFETVAVHLHLHPNALLDDLCTPHPVKETEAVRHLSRVAILHRIYKFEAPELHTLVNSPPKGAVDLLRGAYKDGDHWIDTRGYKRVFPHWPVPLVDPFALPVCLVTRLSPGLERVIDLRRANFEAFHGHYELLHESFENLRLECSRVKMYARQAIRYAGQVETHLDEIIPDLQKIISLFSTMIAFYEELHGGPPEGKGREDFDKAIKRRSDLMLLSDACTQYVLEESGFAEKRDRALGIMQSSLDAIDPQVVQHMLSWGAEHVPTVVWYEYHEAMRAAAKAVAAAPGDFARTVIREHFVPALRTLVDSVEPGFDTSAFETAHERSLAGAIKDFDVGALSDLDRSQGGAAFVCVQSNLAELLRSSSAALEVGAGLVTHLETAADVTSSLGPLVATYLGESATSTTRGAGFLARAVLPFLGDDVANQEQLVRLLANHGASPSTLHAELKGLQAKVGEAFDVPADRLERSLYSSVVWPSVQVVLQMASVLAWYDPDKKELTQLDYAKLTEAAAAILGTAAKVALLRFEGMLQERVDDGIMSAVNAAQAKAWLRCIEKGGVFVVTSAASLWTAHATAVAKREKGDFSGRKDIQAAVFGVSMNALSTKYPMGGFIVSLCLSMAEFFASLTAGTEAHTRVYYTTAWAQVHDKIWSSCALRDVKFDDMNLSHAYVPAAPTKNRMRALCYIINSGRMEKTDETPDGLLWLWSLSNADRGRLERMLQGYGFSNPEIDFLRERS